MTAVVEPQTRAPRFLYVDAMELANKSVASWKPLHVHQKSSVAVPP